MIQTNIIYSNREIYDILKNKAKYGVYYLMYDDIYFEEIKPKENISREFYMVARRYSKNSSIIKHISFNYKEDYTTKDMFELLNKLRRYATILLILYDSKDKECNLLFIGNDEDYKLEKYINDFVELEAM